MENENDFSSIDEVTTAQADTDDAPPSRKRAKVEDATPVEDCEGDATPIVVITRKASGPRGPLPHVAERRNHVRGLIQAAALLGPVTINEIVSAHGVHYYDVLWVAREEVEAGRLVESKKGRKSTFVLPE
jgi:hypothetical protein